MAASQRSPVRDVEATSAARSDTTAALAHHQKMRDLEPTWREMERDPVLRQGLKLERKPDGSVSGTITGKEAMLRHYEMTQEQRKLDYWYGQNAQAKASAGLSVKELRYPDGRTTRVHEHRMAKHLAAGAREVRRITRPTFRARWDSRGNRIVEVGDDG